MKYRNKSFKKKYKQKTFNLRKNTKRKTKKRKNIKKKFQKKKMKGGSILFSGLSNIFPQATYNIQQMLVPFGDPIADNDIVDPNPTKQFIDEKQCSDLISGPKLSINP